ncbi:37S ribosomal protein, mitochondrial [Zygosaccharomyces mellis]|uniref:37S ribosomal protein, mitochondrial n=1 Tax=Zygosaccharomyces mellis TaxID=42258 RepID=A0A4C2E845_9SACH|nr:37S ribosomal protein, mitochondrial [Zygosaccharomyces mellis]
MSALRVHRFVLATRYSLVRGLPRFSSTNSTPEVKGEDSSDDEVFVMRQKHFNDQIVSQLKALSETPLDKINGFQTSLSQPLTEKEKQLDEELTEFLTKYSKLNKVINNEDVNSSDSTGRIDGKPVSHHKKYPYLVPSSRDRPYTSQELFLRQMKHASHTARLGANIEQVYSPHKDVNNPLPVEKVSINKLLEAGVHLGQSVSIWRPSTQPFIYGQYKGIHLINLNKTLSSLKRAAKVVEGVSERGGVILYVGTREGQKRALEEAAKRTNGYYISTRWIPGTLTNSSEISGVWERHEVDFADNPTNRQLTPAETLGICKPDLIVVLNPTENRNALRESMQARVPTIGIIDTDSEPSMVTYPIPGNDDSLRSVNLILGVLSRAGQRGRANRLAKCSTDAE